MKSAKWLLTIKDSSDQVYSSYEIDEKLAKAISKEVFDQI